MNKADIKTPSLKVNISWTFLGNVIYAITQWGLLISIAKFGTATMVGQFTLGLALTAPVFMLTNLQLRTIQATDIKNKYTFGDFIGLRIFTVIIFIILMVLITVIFKYEAETTLVILFLTIAKAFESISDIIFGLLQKNEVMKKIAISRIIKGISSLIVMTIMLKITKNLLIAILGLALSWLIVLLYIDIRFAKTYANIKPNFNINKMKMLFILSLPLGIAHMLGSLNTNIPRYLLEYFESVEVLGYFAAIAYLMVAGSTVILAMGHAVTPRLSKYYHNNIKLFVRLIFKLMLLGFSIGLFGIFVAIIAGEEILSLIYSEEYAKYNNILILIIVGSTFNFTSSFLGYGITAAQCFKIQPIMNVTWIISTIGVGYSLIRTFGIEGAAYTLIVSSIIQLLTRAFVIIIILKRKLKSHEGL